MEDLCAIVVDDLSIWQTLLLGLWIFCHLLHRLAGSSTEFLRHAFLDTLGANGNPREEGTHGCEVRVGSSSFDDSGAGPATDPGETSGSEGSLIPSLLDELVRERIWPVLVNPLSILTLLDLRHLSTSWNRFVGGTLEWNALTFMWLDWTGYYRYILQHGMVRQSPIQRLWFELANFRYLIAQGIDEIESRVRFSRMKARSMPFYVSIEDCPPSMDDCPEYYDL